MGRLKSVLRTDRALTSAQEPRAPKLTSEMRLLTMRRQSLGRRLYSLYRIYDSLVLEALHEGGFSDIRPVHTDVLRSVELGGSRLTDVAASCNITKQAASQVVKELVELGYLSLLTVPHDTRVRMVVFTERGMSLILQLGENFTQIDARLAELIGEDKLKAFREDLDRMIRGFEGEV